MGRSLARCPRPSLSIPASPFAVENDRIVESRRLARVLVGFVVGAFVGLGVNRFVVLAKLPFLVNTPRFGGAPDNAPSRWRGAPLM